jgi:hypothetical protein
MNRYFLRPEIGQWYTRADKGEMFQVVGRDENSRAIEIQSFDDELDEIDTETCATLPLERAEPPEDWTGPLDDVETDDLGYSETAMAPADFAQLLEPIRLEGESWEKAEPEEERDPLGEGAPEEHFTADVPGADKRAR